MFRFSSAKLVITCLCIVTAASAGVAMGRAPAAASWQASMGLAELPRQGVETYTLIHQGGPFASEKDGATFGNRERILPAKKRGYYLEYTVPTPGLNHRGVKRIVCGGARTTPDVCYYTADHYASFRKIVP